MMLEKYMVRTKYVTSGVGIEGGDRLSFIGMIEDLIVSAAGAEYVTQVYVAPTMDPTYRLILGVPYQVAARCEITRKQDGTCIVGIRDSNTGQRVRIVAADAEYDKDAKMSEMLEHTRGHGHLNA